MELMTLIHAFSVTLSFMLVSCASDQLIVQKAAQQYVSDNSVVQQRQITVSLLPRKLKLEKVADVKSSSADKDIMLQKKLLDSSSGKKENVVREAGARKGSWREWVERGPSKSEYFTMDYSWVRRRRPIHNQANPISPIKSGFLLPTY